MAENKRKAQLSLDGSSHRHRIVSNTTDTSGGSIPLTINVPTIQGIDTDREASGTRLIVYSRCNTNGTGTIDTMTSSEILSGIHKNKWERSNTMPYNYLVKVLDDIKNNVLVGKIGGEVCSMLSFRFIGRGQKDTTISLVWTSESHRKKGYSTQLLRTAVPWLLDNSFLHSGSTSMDGQHMCRSQNWDEAFVNSFSTEVKKLRKNLEEKLRQKSTGSNNNWEITIDHNDILAVYTLPQQNSSSETTNEVTTASQLSRRSGRRKCTREPLNIGHSVSAQKQTYGNDYAEKESALKRQDPNEKNGRDLWLLSKNSKKLPFLSKINGRIGDWIFYPSKHECRTLPELIARGSIQGVHYADGYPELGEIVTKYGKDVADWPNLPPVERSEHETIGNFQNPTTTTSAADRHSPCSDIAPMRASNTTNRVSLSPDPTRTAPIGTKSEQNHEATHAVSSIESSNSNNAGACASESEGESASESKIATANDSASVVPLPLSACPACGEPVLFESLTAHANHYKCKLWYLHMPPKNNRGGYDAASYATELKVRVIQQKSMLELGIKSVRDVQHKDILVFRKFQGDIDDTIQYMLKELEAYFDQAIISAKCTIKKDHTKLYGKHQNKKNLKTDEWISKIEQPGFDGKYGKLLTDEVRNAFMNDHIVPELSNQKSEFCKILKGKNFRQILEATKYEKVVNTLSLAMVSVAHSSDILKAIENNEESEYFDRKKNLPPQVERSKDETSGNVQNLTTATSAAAHCSFVHPDAIQSSSSTTTDIVLPHHDSADQYTYQNEVDLTCGGGDSDDEE